MGQSTPLEVDLPYADVEALADALGHSRHLLGHLTQPDEDGVCRGVVIGGSRVQCAIESG